MDFNDFLSSLDKDHPIQLKDLEKIIDKISLKYPHLDKMSIALIVKAYFEEIRKFLVSGKTLKIQGFLNFTKLKFTKKGVKIKNSAIK